uniref:Uncharacterized protein n=1 Tax=viral metagenome TaxID=1070528 RepID=A0A6C0LQ03_9ZZZZ
MHINNCQMLLNLKEYKKMKTKHKEFNNNFKNKFRYY